ncbi:23S rRNA (adenine(2030)-N(6))-methyltransferase RlmJ [Primorskyibacter flagellatus]|uniref:23S rRNA (adenine(2030)-N(6))-methyltransferase RlmJ n=1 Tax=Primorskyibacter flagellatus TaxID=1387277 RepID=UPI003A8FA545
MLSYQHIYHAGNLADVHKHSLLAWMLNHLIQKAKPLTYLETHAGRALYRLDAAEALKTGEAAQGIARAAALNWFPDSHPFAKTIRATHSDHGENSYPGSPLIASQILRPMDSLHLAELHPQEFAALDYAVPKAKCYQQDGFEMAQSICPPTPRRGLLLIDPSYEVKTDYDLIPTQIAALNRKWNVGIIMLWYPILSDAPHRKMLSALSKAHPDALRHEVSFPPARQGHRMVGSGLFILNPPYRIEDETARLSKLFATL